jgi:hypothetical protein
MIKICYFNNIKFSEYKRARELLVFILKNRDEERGILIAAMRILMRSLHYNDKIYYRMVRIVCKELKIEYTDKG